jgi:hypothetical protein
MFLGAKVRKKELPGYDFQVGDGVAHVFRPDLVNAGVSFLNLGSSLNSSGCSKNVGGFASVELQDVMQNIIPPRNLPLGAGEGGSYTTPDT